MHDEVQSESDSQYRRLVRHAPDREEGNRSDGRTALPSLVHLRGLGSIQDKIEGIGANAVQFLLSGDDCILDEIVNLLVLLCEPPLLAQFVNRIRNRRR